MGVDHAKRRDFFSQVGENTGDDDMLENVGKVAGMKGMAVVHRSRRWAVGNANSCHVHSEATATYAPTDASIDRRHPSAPAHGRHDELVAPASAALDLFAATELKIAGHTNLDISKPPAAAGN